MQPYRNLRQFSENFILRFYMHVQSAVLLLKSYFLPSLRISLSPAATLGFCESFASDHIITAMSYINEKKRPGNKTYYKGLDADTKDARARDIERKSKMALDDPRAYEPMPGDEKEPKKQSVYNQRFKKMFGGKDEDVSYEDYIDKMDQLLESNAGRSHIGLLQILESEDIDQAREDALFESDSVTKSLRNKAKLANAPMAALRAIYNKGLAAYKTGHRPGVPQHAWAMGRVNSVLTGGPARKVDSAEWKRISDYRKKKRGKKRK